MTTISLVTGASRGLGRNTALSIARHGGDVIVTYRSGKEGADAAVAEIQALGRKAVALQLDTGNVASFVYMAKELGTRGITVNTVAPGAIETDFLGGAVRDIPDYNKAFAGMTALGRVGVPDDIGPMVASLLGPDNRWVNGQRIEVSGGQTI